MKHNKCPLTYALTIVGGKWKPIIISHLKKSPKRFGKLDALIPTISRKVLSTQLSELVGHKMLNRVSYPETPPRVEYSLTDKAKELVPIFETLAEWGYELVKKTSKPND